MTTSNRHIPLDFTERELALILQSIEAVDWTYAGEQNLADRVILKCSQAIGRLKKGTPEGLKPRKS